MCLCVMELSCYPYSSCYLPYAHENLVEKLVAGLLTAQLLHTQGSRLSLTPQTWP